MMLGRGGGRGAFLPALTFCLKEGRECLRFLSVATYVIRDLPVKASPFFWGSGAPQDKPATV